MAQAPHDAQVVIGLDVGTTAAKVSAFALGGRWRVSAGNEYPLQQPQTGWEVQEPEVMWRALREGLVEIAAEVGAAEVIGIGVSTAMHGLIGLDADQRPVTPLLTWADSRAAEQAMRLRDTELGRRLHRTSGTPIHSMSQLTKLRWFAENDPETASAVRWWVGLKDFVLLQLTGRLVTEVSNASGTGLLDLAARDWSDEALEVAGVRREQLPPVLPTTEALLLRPELAADLGLPGEVRVVLGAGDGPLGNLGVGALEPGVVGLSLGTSGAVRMVTDRPYVDERGTLFCYNLADDAWVIGGAISNGGIVVRWGGDVFGVDFADEPGGNPDGMLLELARDVPIGADGLIALPFLMAERAPLWNPTIPGAFLGVRRSHTREYFVRAAVEGVALMLSTVVDELDRVSPIRQIRATGGVFRSTLWRDVLAAALGRPLVVTDGAEGTALGAAALTLYGLGRSASLRDALIMLGADPDAGSDELVPDPADVAAYRAVRAGIPALLARYDEVRTLFS
ncbi:MAG: gluconokinase [Micropruina sp.]|uniref:gluconokinase n=1 Tax=Micropruina sp. TaxID=2737536 RepID=UPI0039E57D59